MWTWCLFFQSVGCTFYCFGLFNQLRNLVNFCIKKKQTNVLCIKTPALANLFSASTPPLATPPPARSHLLVSQAIPSWLCCHHGNSSRSLSEWQTVKSWCRSRADPSIITLFFVWESKVTEFTLAYTWLPPPPGDPHPTPPTPTQQRSTAGADKSIKSHIRDQCYVLTKRP